MLPKKTLSCVLAVVVMAFLLALLDAQPARGEEGKKIYPDYPNDDDYNPTGDVPSMLRQKLKKMSTNEKTEPVDNYRDWTG